MLPGELRADTAARTRIRSLLTQTIGDRQAYRCNLYHRSDGWYYQLHGEKPTHLGKDVKDVAATVRQIAIVQQHEHWH